MKHIHHISHIDLDGYTCTYLIRDSHEVDYDTDPDAEAVQLNQTNVDYDQLTQHLDDVLSQYTPQKPLDRLIITDLNLKAADVDVLVKYRDRFDHFTLVDHHRTDPADLERLETEVGSSILIDRTASATYHLYGLLEKDPFGQQKAFVDLVDTYDMFRVEKGERFTAMYLFNDWFMQLTKDTRPLLTDEGHRTFLIQVLKAFRRYISEDPDPGEPLSSGVHKFTETLFTDPLFIDTLSVRFFDEDVALHLKEGDADGLPAPLARAALLGHLAVGPQGILGESVHTLPCGDVLITDAPVPRGVLYTLMYDQVIIDQYVILRNPEKGRVEFRQHKLTPRLDLSVIAAMWGGGGHVGAAGCHINESWSAFVPKLLERLTHSEILNEGDTGYD